MKARPGALGALVLWLGTGSCGTAPDQEDDRAAVRAVLDQALERFAAADAEGLMSLYADDAVWMLPSRREELDKASALDYYQGLFEAVTPSGYRAERAIELAGNWAFARVTYEGVLRSKEGGETRRGFSRHVTILERQSDGSWKIRWDIFNTPPLD